MRAHWGTTVYLVRFYLVAVNANPYFWSANQHFLCRVVNITNGIEQFEVAAPIPITNIADFSVVTILLDWYIDGNVNLASYQALYFKDQINATHIRIEIYTGSSPYPWKVVGFGATIVWINRTALALTNHPRYTAGFDINLSPVGSTPFSNYLPMFSIPELYYPGNSVVQPRCLIGPTFIHFSGSLVGDYTGAYFSSTTNPFGSFQIFLTHFSSGNYQGMTSDYVILCFDR